MSNDDYQIRYKTGTRFLISCMAFCVVFILMLGVSIIAGSAALIIAAGIGLLFAAGSGWIALRGYREMLLYADRLDVVTLLDGVVHRIPLGQVIEVRYTNSFKYYRYPRQDQPDSVHRVPILTLHILMQKGKAYEFNDDEYDYLTEIGDLIRQRTAL